MVNSCVCGEVLVQDMATCPACQRSNLQYRKPLFRSDVVLLTLGLGVATVALRSFDSLLLKVAIVVAFFAAVAWIRK